MVASTIAAARAVKRAGVAPICNMVTSLASTPNWRRLDRVRNSDSEPNRLMANFFPRASFKVLNSIDLKWHQIGDRPEVLDIHSTGPCEYCFWHSSSHDLYVAADKCLQIGCTRIEHHHENIESLV